MTTEPITEDSSGVSPADRKRRLKEREKEKIEKQTAHAVRLAIVQASLTTVSGELVPNALLEDVIEDRLEWGDCDQKEILQRHGLKKAPKGGQLSTSGLVPLLIDCILSETHANTEQLVATLGKYYRLDLAEVRKAALATPAKPAKPERGVCRICGCMEETPCDVGIEGACAWADRSQTLCTNPSCLAAAKKGGTNGKAAGKAGKEKAPKAKAARA